MFYLQDMRLKTYPHIPRHKLLDLYTIGATREQHQMCDAACKTQVDRRLHSYTLEDAGPGGTSPGGTDPEGAAGGARPRTTMVVVGARGAGKSATGNTLLEEKCFHEGAGADSQTVEECSRLSATDSLLTVIDTPGSWTLAKDNKVVEICVHMCMCNILRVLCILYVFLYYLCYTLYIMYVIYMIYVIYGSHVREIVGFEPMVESNQ